MSMPDKCPCCLSSLWMRGNIFGCTGCSYIDHTRNIEDIPIEYDLDLEVEAEGDIVDYDEC